MFSPTFLKSPVDKGRYRVGRAVGRVCEETGNALCRSQSAATADVAADLASDRCDHSDSSAAMRRPRRGLHSNVPTLLLKTGKIYIIYYLKLSKSILFLIKQVAKSYYVNKKLPKCCKNKVTKTICIIQLQFQVNLGFICTFIKKSSKLNVIF